MHNEKCNVSNPSKEAICLKLGAMYLTNAMHWVSFSYSGRVEMLGCWYLVAVHLMDHHLIQFITPQ